MKMASARKSLMSRAQTAIFMAVNPGSLWQIVAGLLRFTPQVFAARRGPPWRFRLAPSRFKKRLGSVTAENRLGNTASEKSI